MAIEASGFTEKDELIAKFYTVRAGLSVIAEESKKIADTKSSLNFEQEEFRRNKDNYEKKKSKFRMESKECENRVVASKRNIQTAENKLKELEFRKKEVELNSNSRYSSFRVGLMITSCVVGAIFLIIAHSILGFIFTDVYDVCDYDNFTAVFCFIGIPVLFLLSFIIPKTEQNIEGRKVKENITIDLERDIAFTEKQLSTYKKEYEGWSHRYQIICASKPLEEEQVAIDTQKSQIDLLESELNKEIIPISTRKAKVVRNALIKNIGNIITEDDWANVDLLIFYLNTGRADSLKEALLLVDKQRQTDQIANAIKTAAGYICNTINENTYRLATVINNCFSNLSRQIDQNHREVIDTMERNSRVVETAVEGIENRISDGFRNLWSTIEAQGKSFIDAENLNASLLRQANKSSDELVEALRENKKYWY